MPLSVNSSNAVKKAEKAIIIVFKPILPCYLCNYRVKPNKPNSPTIKPTRLDQTDKINQAQVYKVAYAPMQNLTRAKSKFAPLE
jgi:hypothetical protein